MLTLEKDRELFGTLPKEVEEDSFYRDHFLEIHSNTLRDRGEAYIKENSGMLLAERSDRDVEGHQRVPPVVEERLCDNDWQSIRVVVPMICY